jgi:hypothetical protein
VCGKDPATAALQDLLVYATKGLAMYAHRARQLGVRDREVDVFTVEALFSTVTNVNFDPERLRTLLLEVPAMRARIKQAYEQAAPRQARRQGAAVRPPGSRPRSRWPGEAGRGGGSERRQHSAPTSPACKELPPTASASPPCRSRPISAPRTQVHALGHEGSTRPRQPHRDELVMACAVAKELAGDGRGRCQPYPHTELRRWSSRWARRSSSPAMT